MTGNRKRFTEDLLAYGPGTILVQQSLHGKLEHFSLGGYAPQNLVFGTVTDRARSAMFGTRKKFRGLK
jgi:hypothetical protein